MNHTSLLPLVFLFLVIEPASCKKQKQQIGINQSVSDSISTSLGQVTFNSGFEIAPLWNFMNKGTAKKPWSMNAIDTSVAREGKYALRIELRKDDPDADIGGSKRSELAVRPEDCLQESGYFFSIYLPKGGNEDYLYDTSPEILAQWHGTPDVGEPWTNPPLALVTSKGNWFVNRCWDEDSITLKGKMRSEGKYEYIDLGSYTSDKGKWTNWSFRVKWGWLPEHKTKLQVYKNGIKVLERTNVPNTTNDKKGVFFKIGIYKWDWKTHAVPSIINRRVVYYDAVKIVKYLP